MPDKKQEAGLDDYYSHIPSSDNTSGNGDEKKGLKLKIKAKKPSSEELGGVSVSSEPVKQEAVAPVEATVSPVSNFPQARVISRAPEAPARQARPQGSRPQGDRPQGDRPRPQGSGYQGNRPQGDRPAGTGYQGNRPQGDRPQGDRPRPQGSGYQGNRPQGDRPAGTGYQGNRPQGDRPQNAQSGSFSSQLRKDEEARRPQKKFEPRISFEPAKPIVSSSSSSGSDSGAGKDVRAGAGKLAEYTARHKGDAPRFDSKKKKGGGSRFEEDRGGKKGGIKTHRNADDDGFRRSGKLKMEPKKEKNLDDVKQTLVDKTGQEVEIAEILAVKEFSEKIGVPLPKIIAELMKNGMLVSLNTKIDFDTCFIVGEAFGVKINRERNANISASSILEGNVEAMLKNDDASRRVNRAPIVSIMGHVDHGKTSILDYIRKTAVASGEAGGITQKIGAYQVERNGAKITFLDTPGHEAFSIMRSRGAKLTDVSVIVVAADEGMKPQTIESINHARAAEVPMIIAVNKMDKPGANLDLIRGQLAEQGLQPEDWGGDTVVVPVSAHTGLGIETLLDMIVLTTEMMELTADPGRAAIGTVIESHLDPKLGPLSTVLINAGTLKKGEYVVCANVYGRIRALKDFRGKNLDEAGPSVPVQITGLSGVVEGGDILQAVSDAETAAAKAHEYQMLKNTKSVHNFEGASLDMLMSRIKAGGLKQLKVVLKCDSNGSLEALKNALGKLSTEETKVTFIHSGVGDVNDSDVLMAGTSQALLIAYNVSVNVHARSTLANSKIEFIDKKVIYHIIEKVEAIITGMVDLRYDAMDLGSAVVKAIFYNGKDKLIVGLEVKDGVVENRAKIRVVRDNKKAGSGEVVNLKSGPSDVHEIEAGSECGISFKGDVKLEEGDRLEFYKMVARK